MKKDINEINELHNDKKARIAKIFKLILAAMVLLIFQQVASLSGGWFAKLFSYRKIDPDNTFMSITVHHIVQGVIALTAIFIIWKIKKYDFGFKLGNGKIGLQYLTLFSLGVLLFAIILYLIGISLGLTQLAQYPLNARNVLGTLGFQLFLSGPSEEILFRALPIVVISRFSKGGIKIGRFYISYATLIAAALFVIAHIGWSLSPFSISADPVQLVQAFVFAIFYGKAFEKSGSILYPALMHSASNVIMVGMGYVIASIL